MEDVPKQSSIHTKSQEQCFELLYIKLIPLKSDFSFMANSPHCARWDQHSRANIFCGGHIPLSNEGALQKRKEQKKRENKMTANFLQLSSAMTNGQLSLCQIHIRHQFTILMFLLMRLSTIRKSSPKWLMVTQVVLTTLNLYRDNVDFFFSYPYSELTPMAAKIKSWTCKFLSYAGRASLVRCL